MVGFGPASWRRRFWRLSAEMRKAITAPEVRTKLEGQDLIIIANA